MSRSTAGKGAQWEAMLNDPRTPKEVKGWIQQERNSGRSWSNVRNPPGYELAHVRGCEAKKGFDYSYTVLQDKGLHKLQHRHDAGGRLNRTHPAIQQYLDNGGSFKDKSFHSMSDRLTYVQKANGGDPSPTPTSRFGGNLGGSSRAMGTLARGLGVVGHVANGYGVLGTAEDAYATGVALANGDYRGAAASAGSMAGGFAGGIAGAELGATAGAFVGPLGALAGGIIGGLIGGFFGAMGGQYAGTAVMDACVNGAGIGKGGGDIGGVAVRSVASIPRLKLSATFLLQREHVVAIPLSPGSSTLQTISKVLPGVDSSALFRRVVHEVFWALHVERAPLLFSLHFAEEGYLYPVLHPHMQHTVTGYVLGMLDYFLKGFINGGVYDPAFLLGWHKTKNMDRDHLRAHAIDLRQHLRSSGCSIPYQSLRERCDDDDDEGSDETMRSHLETSATQPQKQQNQQQQQQQQQRKKLQAYRSAFRILGNLAEVRGSAAVFEAVSGFDVEHDLNPSAETRAAMGTTTAGEEARKKHKAKAEAYQAMHEAIREQMPQVPMFREWFEVLKVISFAAHYAQTLYESGMVPDLAKPPEKVPAFPDAMPPIPVRRVKTFTVNVTLDDMREGVDASRIDSVMADIVHERAFSLAPLAPDFETAARAALKRRLQALLPSDDVDLRSDTELHVAEVVGHFMSVLTQCVRMTTDGIVSNVVSQLVQAEVPGAKALERELQALKTFKLRVERAKRRIRELLEKRRSDQIAKLNEEKASVAAKVRRAASDALNTQLRNIDQQQSEAHAAAQASHQRRLASLDSQEREKLEEIESQVRNCPSGYSINHTAVENAKSDLRSQVARIRAEYEQDYNNNINRVNQEVQNVRARIRRDVDQQQTSQLTELDASVASSLANINQQHTELLGHINSELGKGEQNADHLFTNLMKTELKSHILLDSIRLSFFTVGDRTAWNEGVMGGCSVQVQQQPTFIDADVVDLAPIVRGMVVDGIEECIVGGKWVARVPVKHTWYAAPPTFAESVEDKRVANGCSPAVDVGTSALDAKDRLVPLGPGGVVNGNRVLDWVVHFGDCDLVSELVEKHGASACTMVANDRSAPFAPLLSATAQNRADLVRALLEKCRADPNIRHANGLTPLLIAVQNGFGGVAMALLSAGASPKVELDNGMTPLHFAVTNGDAQLAAELVSRGATVTSPRRLKDGQSPFHLAAAHGSLRMLEALVNVDPEAVFHTTVAGDTALHLAAGSGEHAAECVKLLLSKGADSRKTNKQRQRPLHVAVASRCDAAAVLLYEAEQASAAAADQHNFAPLDLAVINGATGFLAFVNQRDPALGGRKSELSGGVRLAAKARSAEDAIHSSLARQNVPDSTRLLQQYAKLSGGSVRPQLLEAFIGTALLVGSAPMLDLVIRATEDITKVRFSNGRALSHLVVESGQSALVEGVHRLAFEFTEKDDAGHTPVRLAVAADDDEMLLAILNAATPSTTTAEAPSSPQNDGVLITEAVQQAFEQRKVNCIKALVEAQARRGRDHRFSFSGAYLCTSVNVTERDVALACDFGVSFSGDDVKSAACNAAPAVVLAVLRAHCSNSEDLRDSATRDAVTLAVANKRLDVLLALRQVASDAVTRIMDRLARDSSVDDVWVQRALTGDTGGRIAQRLTEIRTLLHEGVDVHAGEESASSAIKQKLQDLLRGFPVGNMQLGGVPSLPLMHTAMVARAPWAFTSCASICDPALLFDDATAFDLLPFISEAQKYINDLAQHNAVRIVDNLTPSFANLVLKRGGHSRPLLEALGAIAHKATKPRVLHVLVRAKADAKVVKEILQRQPVWLNARDDEGWTPLMRALDVGSFEVATQLLKNMPPEGLRATNHRGETALHVLLSSRDFAADDPALVQLALRIAQLEPRILLVPRRDGSTVGMLASHAGHLALVAAFQGHVASTDGHSLMLHAAAAGNRVGVIRFLCLQLAVPPDAPLTQVHRKRSQVLHDSPLHTAARNSADTAFAELLRLGGSLVAKNADRQTVMEVAVSSPSEDLAALAISHPQLIDASADLRGKVVVSAARGARSNVSTLATLLDIGFPASALSEDGISALQYAAIHDNVAAVHCVLDAGVDLKHTTGSKQSVLHICSAHKSPGTLRACLEWGLAHLPSSEFTAWMDARDRDGNTALHLAAAANDDDSVAVLLAYNASCDVENASRLSPDTVATVHAALKSMGVFRQVLKRPFAAEDSVPLEHRPAVRQLHLDLRCEHKRVPETLSQAALTELQKHRDTVARRLREADPATETSDVADAEQPAADDSDVHHRALVKGFGKGAADIITGHLDGAPLAASRLLTVTAAIPDARIAIDRVGKLVESGAVPVDVLVATLPGVPDDAAAAFAATLEATAQKAAFGQMPALWDWFVAHFRMPCDPASLAAVEGALAPAKWTEWFDQFLTFVDPDDLENPLASPTLAGLSVFLGDASAMGAVATALQLCSDPRKQMQFINAIPLRVESIRAIDGVVRKATQRSVCFFTRHALIPGVDGGTLPSFIVHQVATRSRNVSTLVLDDAVAALALRASISGRTALLQMISDLDRTAAAETKFLIVRTALQSSEEETALVQAWGAAAEMVHEQCGDAVLEALCELVEKLGMRGVLDVCGIIVRLRDTIRVRDALQRPPREVKQAIDALLEKEQASKGIDQILREMTQSSSATDFRPHLFPFDGRPVVCVSQEEADDLRRVHTAMVGYQPPSTTTEIRRQCRELGKQLCNRPALDGLGRLLALLRHSYTIVFKLKPYTIQCMTVAALLLAEITPRPGRKGRIAQVATGEGKSIDVVLLAAICAVQGRTVDVITSTHYLAKRDQKKAAPFFEFIGVTSGTVAIEPFPTPAHFEPLVLYGINTDFEFTVLREGIQSKPIQLTKDADTGLIAPRVSDTVITDESDNLFIDNALNAARIAWPSDENVSWVFAPLLQIVQATRDRRVTLEDARSTLQSYQGGRLADAVAKFSDERLTTWISSAYESLKRVKGKDYVVGPGQRSSKLEVQIVHLGTGRIQHGSRWSNGVHEFVEAREGLVPENENFTIASIAHPAFFGRYRHVYGLTGTAGEPVEREEVESTYEVDTFDVPPHRECKRVRTPTEVMANKTDLHEKLLGLIKQTAGERRPILLLFLSIDDTIEFSTVLRKHDVVHNVLNELQREDEDYIVFRAGQPGAVTVATNTAGRGTDIVLTPAVREAGGLRVCFTFFPENFRVECQGLGRAGRQGDPGTSEIYTSLDDPLVRQLGGVFAYARQGDSDFVETLYNARSKDVAREAAARKQRCEVEKALFAALKVFFGLMNRLQQRFLTDRAFVAKFTASHLNPVDVWLRLQQVLQMHWARLFSKMANDRAATSPDALVQIAEREFRDQLVVPMLRADTAAAYDACRRVLSGAT